MKKLIFLCMSTILVGFLLLNAACSNSGSNDPEDSDASVANGTVSVNITNAPDGNYLWVFAYEEDEWNTDMVESVLSTRSGEIRDNSAEITLYEGCDPNTYQPTGGEWSATGGETYDLYIYTTEDAAGNYFDKQATFPTQVDVDGDETVEIDYRNMIDYDMENGTLKVSVSGAKEHNGKNLSIGVVEYDDDPETDAVAYGSAEITDGTATVNAQVSDADWTGTGETTYQVYIIIDVDGSGNGPTTGDYVIDPMPVAYCQDGNRVMDTVYPDDYEEYSE